MGQPITSIIINNYNYGEFLAAAIDSALAQTQQPVEVIVVDDGSTDDSAALIERYGDRVTSVLKENGGQGSAFNAGFALARGAIVMFLDSDDLLFPTAVEQVMRRSEQLPRALQLQFRLAITDRDGTPTGELYPSSAHRLGHGDFRRQGPHMFNYMRTPTSANAFLRVALEQIFPVPDAVYIQQIDNYLSRCCAALGPIAAFNETIGYYRIHGRTHSQTNDLPLARIHADLVRFRDGYPYVRRVALAAGTRGLPAAPLDVYDLDVATERMASLRCTPGSHPFAKDRRHAALANGVRSALGRQGLSVQQRALHIGWFAVMACAPRQWTHAIATWLFVPQQRMGIHGMLSRARTAVTRRKAVTR